MTRTISSHLTTMLAGREHSRARCLYLALQDGTTLGFTDHDVDLVIDMPDVSDMAVTYRADLGILPSDVTLSIGMDADAFEVTGPLSDVITRAGVMGGRYKRALARLFDVDWSQSSPDILPILQGSIGETRCTDLIFTFEVRSDSDRLNQSVGDILTPTCRADFGDTKCRAVVPYEWTTITAVGDDFHITVDLAAAHANDFYNYGQIEFQSGVLLGIRPIEIFDYVGATGALTLLVPLPELPTIGDQVVIKRGCSKLLKSDDTAKPTCYGYGNVINFQGEPRMPTSDQYLKVPVPGSNGA